MEINTKTILKLDFGHNFDPEKVRYLHYDSIVDDLLVLFSESENETVVHPINGGDVGIVYDPESMVAQGFQIDCFEKFLAQHKSVAESWKLKLSQRHLTVGFSNHVVRSVEKQRPIFLRAICPVIKEIVIAQKKIQKENTEV